MNDQLRCGRAGWLLLLLGLLGRLGYGQAPAWQAAQVFASASASPGSPAVATVTKTVPGAGGTVYLAGYFTATISLSSLSLTAPPGSLAGFVAK